MSDAPDTASFESALAAALSTGEPAAEQAPAVAPAPALVAATALSPEAQAAPAPAPVPKYVLDREAALEAREARLRDVEADAAAFKRAQQHFERDPGGYIRALKSNLPNAAVAERLYMEELGDAAPVEHRMRREVAEVAKTADEIRAEFAQYKAAADESRRQAEVAKYRAELQQYAANVTPESHPVLSGVASRNPGLFADIMLQHAVQAAQASQGKNVPSEKELADSAERFLTQQRDLFYGPPQPVAQPQPKPVPSFWNRTTSAQPDKQTESEMDDKVLRKRALEQVGLAGIYWE